MRNTIPLMCVAILAAQCAASGGETVGSKSAQTLDEAYPGFVPGALSFSSVKDLPEGVLVESGTVRISEKDFQEEIGKVPDVVREQLQKNAPFLLEEMATPKLLLAAARKHAVEKKLDLAGKPDNAIVQSYLDSAAEGVKVSEKELKDFYEGNLSLCGGATFEEIKKDLEPYVQEKKRSEAVAALVKTLGRRMEIAVSASWLKSQAVPARDNPIDKERGAGKPVLVNFGGAGCCGPDMMLPVFEGLGEKYREKLTLVIVEARQEPVLMARYGMDSIPAQLLLSKDGKEVYRHTGLLTIEDVTRQLEKAGVK